MTRPAAAPALCSPEARRLRDAGLTREVVNAVLRAFVVAQAVREVARSLRRYFR